MFCSQHLSQKKLIFPFKNILGILLFRQHKVLILQKLFARHLFVVCSTVRKKKCTLVQALRLCTGRTAHTGSIGIALLFLNHSTRWGVRDQRHAPAALYPRERPGTHCTRGWVGPRAGLDRRKILSPRDSIPDCPALSQSLFLLSYSEYRYLLTYFMVQSPS